MQPFITSRGLDEGVKAAIYQTKFMVNILRNAFNVVVTIFLITFIALNLFQLGKYLLSSQGLV